MGTMDPDRDKHMKEAEKVDIIIEEEYYQQEEELDYEDNEPAEESPINANEHKVKCPGVWKRLGDPVDDRMSTDTKTGETATLMKSVLGIQSPEANREGDERVSHSRCSDQQYTVLSNDSRRSRGYSSDSSWSSSHSTNSKTSKCQREGKAVRTSGTKTSNKLDVPEAMTPHQSPQQKQIKDGRFRGPCRYACSN